MADHPLNIFFKNTKEYHKRRQHDSLEQKYLILLELQKLALEMRKSKNLPIKAHERVWPVQF